VGYKDLSEGIVSELKPLIISPDHDNTEFRVIDYIQGKFAVRTNLNAPTNKVLLFDKDSVNRAEDFIPSFKEVLRGMKHLNHQLLGIYYANGVYRLSTFSYEGKMLRQSLVDTGFVVWGFQGNPNDSVVLYSKYSTYCPPVSFRLNLNTFKTSVFQETQAVFWPDKYTSHIEIYKSKDGTEIPMYLTYKKDIKFTRNTPVVLQAYGGLEGGRGLSPPANILIYENDAILAIPLIRGRWESGKTWHRAGSDQNMQKGVDDFIAAAEYLIEKGYTSKERLAITGTYFGGTIVSAVITQRPDLFRAAVAQMGYYDLMRYHLFTGGSFSREDLGDIRDSTDFVSMLRYSPLHNLKEKVAYPATLMVAENKHPHASPIHSYKFAASLQTKTNNEIPYFLYLADEERYLGKRILPYSAGAEAFLLSFIFRRFGLPMKTSY
jgi:prolyl oligopeptidase